MTKKLNGWHYAALVCSLIPFFTGSATFIAWMATGNLALFPIGVYIVLAGLVLLITGLLFLQQAWRAARRRGCDNRRQNLLILCLLLANLPLATGMAAYAVTATFSDAITVTNNSKTPISRLVFTDPAGKHYEVGTVQPSKQEHTSFYFEGEGAVRYEFQHNELKKTDVLIGYISGGPGMIIKMDIGPDGSVVITHNYK